MIIKWIKGGLVFGVFSSVILMICPNNRYRKHVSMAIGLLFILVMIQPLKNITKMDIDYYYEYLRNQLMMDKMDVSTKANEEAYVEILEKQILTLLSENGYQVKYIKLKVDNKGNILNVTVKNEDRMQLQAINDYLVNLLGKEVKIKYE